MASSNSLDTDGRRYGRVRAVLGRLCFFQSVRLIMKGLGVAPAPIRRRPRSRVNKVVPTKSPSGDSVYTRGIRISDMSTNMSC